MNRIIAALFLSTAAFGAVQAGELGYLDQPSTQSVATRADVQNALNADRANVDAFQGELNPLVGLARTVTVKQAAITAAVTVAKRDPDDTGTAVAFLNG